MLSVMDDIKCDTNIDSEIDSGAQGQAQAQLGPSLNWLPNPLHQGGGGPQNNTLLLVKGGVRCKEQALQVHGGVSLQRAHFAGSLRRAGPSRGNGCCLVKK